MKYHPEQLFIMDEITSNLDTATRALAVECFKEAMTENITSIVISHNDGFEEITNRHIVVKNHQYHEQLGGGAL
jgi:DNA repair exonuclease SbcCD ATPase subunit